MLRKVFRFKTIARVITILCLLALSLSYLSPFVHPETFWIIPFFGLGYPIIILCTLIILALWGIARSKWFFIVLAFILIGGKLHFRTVSMPFGAEAIDSEDRLKVLSYNVRNFDIYSVMFEQKYSNRDSIFSFLGQSDADVFCFQEFYFQDHPVGFPPADTFRTLLKSDYKHQRMSFNKRYKNYFGVAIYSKYPLIAKGQVDFDDSIANTNNFCIFADLVKGKDTIRIYNTHLQSIKFQEDDYALFGDKAYTGQKKSNLRLLLSKLYKAYIQRANQAQKLVEHMKTSPYEVLICGDFNDTPMSYTYNQFNRHFTDAFRNSSGGMGITYAGKVPAGRIDYMFHSDKLHSANFHIQNDVYSDHRAISCEFWKK